jgi:tRNA threonylcarbamoyladenosine biosynthesis protein TsaB
MPAIAELLRETNTPLEQLSGISVAVGPGSFTGIRIGIATAQGLALPHSLAIHGVSTLALLSCNVLKDSSQNETLLACPVLDARKGEVYGALYHFVGGLPECILAECNAKPVDFMHTLFQKLSDGQPGHSSPATLVFLGNGVSLVKEFIPDKNIPVRLESNEDLMHPKARHLALLSWNHFEMKQNSPSIPVHPLKPHYIRPVSQEFKTPTG